jgi:nitrate/nitrite-specific signal transduction histidine kinase
MENKIIDLERKLKKSLQSAPPPISQPKPAVIPIRSSGIGSAGADDTAGSLGRVGVLMATVLDLERAVNAKDELLLQSKRELITLRSRNAELSNTEIDNQVMQRHLSELQSNYDNVFNDLQVRSSRLVEAEEELAFVRDELLQDQQVQTLLVDGLQDRCGKLNKQNTALLKRLQEMESEIEEIEVNATSTGLIISCNACNLY